MDLDHARWGFQSTRPARGATGQKALANSAAAVQSTRPARGATLPCVSTQKHIMFQSPRPARGATAIPLKTALSEVSPRVGADLLRAHMLPGCRSLDKSKTRMQ